MKKSCKRGRRSGREIYLVVVRFLFDFVLEFSPFLFSFLFFFVLLSRGEWRILLRGTILRTRQELRYTQNLYNPLFLLSIFGDTWYLPRSPVIRVVKMLLKLDGSRTMRTIKQCIRYNALS